MIFFIFPSCPGRYYVSCPVLVLSPAGGGSKKGKKGGSGWGGAGGWARGVVVALEARGSQKVLLEDGGEMIVDPESSMVKFDREVVEPWAVGRHAQVLFDGGIWFVGIVMSVDKSKKKARLRFEDGEVQEVELSDKVRLRRTASIHQQHKHACIRMRAITSQQDSLLGHAESEATDP